MTFPHTVLYLALGVGVMALSACGDAADKLSDAELRSLLRSDSVSADTANPPIDRAAVECLSVWSGDKDLIRELPAGTDTTAAKANCRQRVEGWLVDTTRNPHKLAFGDVATEKTARRALALLNHPVPARVATPAVGHPAGTTPVKPPSPVVVAQGQQSRGSEKVFNGALGEYESLCRQAAAIAKSAKSPSPVLNKRINDCLQRSGQLRAQMNAASAKGNAFETSMIAQNAQRIVDSARRLVEEARKAGH
ncbi:MAG: hypothetical protein WBW61_04725 [Rhodanobacteraceae bacterium]